ncbi:MAG TPA: isoamylase [Bryobacteraceae bacterium]|nr:isoamylase [Bryobacteraceae bacterium]HPQ13876.1 isoamylase [Bryobacteraceae bacterium]HPU71427.1 isoamylase [Bryobacteraceae bacterium]
MTSAQPVIQPFSWAAIEGSPLPLGATYVPSEHAYNFALYAKDATRVTLLLYSESDPVTPVDTYEMRYPGNKTGRIWHCRLPASRVEAVKYYAYRIEGPADISQGHRFDPEKILLDPYADAVYFPPNHSRMAASRPGPNDGRAPLGVIEIQGQPFDWGDDVRPRHGHDTVIYEMHVKGFTARANSGVTPEKRGTYAGVIEKIPYLKELGVTVVELLPVFQYDPQERNYWGYMPLNFFSPHHAYSSNRTPGAQLDEFREMVKALHAAGIEVVLDVVYNHTTESDENGPTYSFRGIDNSTYYLLHEDRSRYRDDTGTGNTLHCANRYVRKMIVDSMRFWAEKMHVDGFRFDLASIFTRNSDGSVNYDDPPVISQITSDPAFEDLRLIAEAWDVSEYQLGKSFPGITWFQWNGKFRDEIRRFVKSDPGMIGSLMTRLYGSDDLFPDERAFGYRPFQSVNYVCSHDGFCLYDLVSYNFKRNLANGHNNTDGTDENYSWNCGWEGDENVPAEVLALRKRQVKNFCTLLMLANGTPMFVAGDEFMNTQGGNNNPYNQDNETTWLNWDLLERNADIFRFFKKMIAFRKAHPSIGRSTFWRSDIEWYGTSGPPDLSYNSHSLAYLLRGGSVGDQDIYVMINAWWEPLTFDFQGGNPGGWQRVVDTNLPSPEDINDPVPVTNARYTLGPRSVAVFVR